MNKQERDYQLSLLVRSVYLRGQADENSQQTNTDWEDGIISQINQLFGEVETILNATKSKL